MKHPAELAAADFACLEGLFGKTLNHLYMVPARGARVLVGWQFPPLIRTLSMAGRLQVHALRDQTRLTWSGARPP